MTDRPILMNAEMVRATLSGAKTQTRRIVTPQPPVKHRWGGWITSSTCTKDEGKALWGAGEFMMNTHRVRCPFGVTGDRLWVRERTRVLDYPGSHDLLVRYEADISTAKVPWPDRIKTPVLGDCLSMGCYREASRITLEVTGVRVERLNAISEANAKAEGIEELPFAYMCPGGSSHSTAVEAFRELWESINGPGSWAANPWVWVINFKRATIPDQDLGKIGPGHVCKHGVRWPHACQPCADAAWKAFGQ